MTFLTAGVGLLASGLAAACVNDFRRWRRRRFDVASAFQRVDTSFGSVPYLDEGPRDGPAVLFVPGGGAGVDLLFAFPWLIASGFRTIAISRPGYSGVPLPENGTLEQHADLYAEVLRARGVGPVHVFGVSAGGSSALHFAARHPTISLTLWCAVTGRYLPNREAMESLLGRLILSPRGQDVLSYLLARSARFFPRATMQSFLTAESTLSKAEQKALIDDTLRAPGGKETFQAFVDATTPMSTLYAGMMDELEKMGEDWAPAWEKIEVPVLAAGSPADKDVTIEHLDRVAAKLPNARILRPRAGGHLLWWGSEGASLIQATLEHLRCPNATRAADVGSDTRT